MPQQETLDQTLVEIKVEELYRCAFETMLKELVQHDERLEKEREDAKRRGADLCSQQGHNTKGKGMKKKKLRKKAKTQPRRKTTCKSQNRNKRQRKEARRGKARRAKPRTRARTRAKGKEQTKQANLHGKSLNQEEREKAKEAKEKDHECSESTVHEFGTRCDRNRPVPPP